MIINTAKPLFSDSILNLAAVSIRKAARVTFKTQGEKIIAEVKANNRLVGKLIFIKEDNNIKLIQRMIIEKDYYPFELIMFSLTSYCKKKKIRNILI